VFLKISTQLGMSSVYEYLIAIHVGQNDMKSATNLAQKMIIENPLHEKALSFLSMINEAVGNFENAARLQKRLMNANPEKSTHKIALGRILLKSTRYEQVISHYRENKISEEDRIFSDSHKAHALIGLNKIDEAQSLFKLIVKENDDFEDALSGLAICYLKKNETELAANMITKCMEIKNKRDESHLDTLLIEQQSSRQNPDLISERALSNSVEMITKPTFRFNPDKKTADKGIERTFLIALASLLNSKGGVIQIGIENRKIQGISRDLQLLKKTQRNDSGFEKEIFRIIKNGIVTGMPDEKITVTFPISNKIKICEIYVKKSDHPIFVKNVGKDEGFYIREKGETIKVKPADQANYIQKNFLSL
jgi:tetratricopeptide (TPR) repeat protein